MILPLVNKQYADMVTVTTVSNHSYYGEVVRSGDDYIIIQTTNGKCYRFYRDEVIISY